MGCCKGATFAVFDLDFDLLLGIKIGGQILHLHECKLCFHSIFIYTKSDVWRGLPRLLRSKLIRLDRVLGQLKKTREFVSPKIPSFSVCCPPNFLSVLKSF